MPEVDLIEIELQLIIFDQMPALPQANGTTLAWGDDLVCRGEVHALWTEVSSSR